MAWNTVKKKWGKILIIRRTQWEMFKKSFLVSDYLLYPSDYMKDIMIHAYCLDNLYKGKIICSGYPRNSIFFYPEKGKELRKKLGLETKKYMLICQRGVGR